ncbi:MAG: hypothetical protein PVI97_08785 [Candidatus Thiodiazotropha sp.]
MKLDEIELHDAILEGISVNYRNKSAVIEVAYYQDSVNSEERTSAVIIFSDVKHLSEVSNFDHLELNRSAGNIAYWHPANGMGTTYIYLVSGLLEITAKSVAFKINA